MYKKGIGQVYQFYNDYAHPIDWQGQIYVTELIYYKKGNKIYGKPMEFITAISDNIVSDIKVYPNPTNDVIYLQGLSEDANDIAYKIYDTFGRIAQSGSISIQNSIDVTTLARGVYILSLSYANESKSSLEKIIIY